MDCGIQPEGFWGRSLGEIRDLLESYARTERRKAREEISARYELAGLIGMYIQLPYDEKKEIHIPHVWEAYPQLFADEKAAFEERKRAELLEQAKASRKEYAKQHNEMRRRMGLR